MISDDSKVCSLLTDGKLFSLPFSCLAPSCLPGSWRRQTNVPTVAPPRFTQDYMITNLTKANIAVNCHCGDSCDSTPKVLEIDVDCTDPCD
mmetsp:Transcript_54370/g.162601  ORF Transcript_54370/g.162601 Transcript_54370/m.162601 type:complete len:91 (-) Transcript_54370:32-304(-)